MATIPRGPGVAPDVAAWHAACVAHHAAGAWAAFGRRDAAEAVLRRACQIWREVARDLG
jgi:hypothetical protein